MFGRVLALLAVSFLSPGVFAGAQEPPPAVQSSDQEEERLWVPEGYRLLSNEERLTLSEEELKTILSRNTVILDAAARQMSPEARAAVIANHQRVAASKPLSPIEKQYVAKTSMLLLSVINQEEDQKERRAQEAAFAQLLKKQEDSTRGFPADQKSVETEAMEIRNLLRQGEDLRKLYLRVLRPLRSRPWNETARVTLRQLLRSDPVSTLPEARKHRGGARIHRGPTGGVARGGRLGLSGGLSPSLVPARNRSRKEALCLRRGQGCPGRGEPYLSTSHRRDRARRGCDPDIPPPRPESLAQEGGVGPGSLRGGRAPPSGPPCEGAQHSRSKV